MERDDDGNGYIDDIYGWNFLGGKDGRNVKQDSYEGARVYHSLKAKYEGANIDTTNMNSDSLEEYKMWLKAKKKINGEGAEGGFDLGMPSESAAQRPERRQHSQNCHAQGYFHRQRP